MLHNPYSSHYYVVPNPSAPFDQAIPNGLVPGKQVSISGHVHPNADRFSFNLMGPGGYVLHVNPRMLDGVVVRNHENYGNWGEEEREGPNPFQAGAPFEIVISVEEDRYRIAVNGHPIFEFWHRIPFNQVERLMIAGDVDVHRIVYSRGGNTRQFDAYNPPVPFEAPVAQGPYPGRMIQIRGRVPHGAGRFDLNLQNGPGVYPPNINFHVSVRFDSGTIVFNNCQHGNWGGEGVNPLERLHPGSAFDVLILYEQDRYKIAINGEHFGDFHFRNPPQEADFIAINGDVELRTVNQF